MSTNWYLIKTKKELMALPNFDYERPDGLLFYDDTFFSHEMFNLPRIIKLELNKYHEYEYKTLDSEDYWRFKRDWVIPLETDEARKAAEILYG